MINAHDAMPDGGTLTVRSRQVTIDAADAPDHYSDGAYLRLSVIDDGTGMSAETRERIFEPFFSTKPVGKGTGLGLSTVYADITRNGGFITVESEPDHGTTFHIFLPLTESGEMPDQEVGQPASLPAPPGSSSQRETILICDDDEIALDSVKILLEIHGYTPLAATCGQQALELARNHPGDLPLLITDITMPEMNGQELASQLRQQRPEVKVIFMSGYGEDALRSFPEETPLFLQKPSSTDELLNLIRDTLDGQKPQKIPA